VWSLSAGAPDDTYKAFATRVSPFPSLHDAARVVDAMPLRALGALLCVELGWLELDGALRRVPDCEPFDGEGGAFVSASARLFWAACGPADSGLVSLNIKQNNMGSHRDETARCPRAYPCVYPSLTHRSASASATPSPASPSPSSHPSSPP
jgi:hypothetical protein